MDKKKLELLYGKADEFGAIARKVNESSKRRKEHSMEILKIIDLSLNIGEELNRKLQKVADANLIQRNQDNIVSSTCRVLKTNMEKQTELINELKSYEVAAPEIVNEIQAKVDDLKSAIDEAMENIREIIEYDNVIILNDSLIIMRKKYQQDSINTLKRLANISLEDSEKAIGGSSSNLDRGLKMVRKFKEVEKLIEKNRRDDLKELAEEAKKGWTIAAEVNKSSLSQLEFAEKVKEYTNRFHEDSKLIEQMVVDKHKIFEQNLQIITVLTVILSIKFKKYLDVGNIIAKIEYNEKIRNTLNNLTIFADIACKDINDVTRLNYDMTDSSHMNNEIEHEAVLLTKKELEYFDRIREEVEKMTEATAYPIEGSAKNIENGRFLEDTLKEIVEEMK